MKPDIDAILHDGAHVQITRRGGPFYPGRYRLRYEGYNAWSIISAKTGIEHATGRDELRDMILGDVLEMIDPNQLAREAQLIAIRAASPMRPIDGRTADVDGLALFDAVRSPVLL
jgi:hypothetical protein